MNPLQHDDLYASWEPIGSCSCDFGALAVNCSLSRRGLFNWHACLYENAVLLCLTKHTLFSSQFKQASVSPSPFLQLLHLHGYVCCICCHVLTLDNCMLEEFQKHTGYPPNTLWLACSSSTPYIPTRFLNHSSAEPRIP